MKVISSAVVAFVIFNSSASAQQLTPEQVGLIVAAADGVCGEYNREGSETSVEVNGKVNAEVSGLIKKLTDAGISGDTKIANKDYSGVFRAELSSELKDVRKCRKAIFDKLVEITFSPTSNQERSSKNCSFPLDPRAASFNPPDAKNALGPVSGFKKEISILDMAKSGKATEALKLAGLHLQGMGLVYGPYSQNSYASADRFAYLLMNYGTTSRHGKELVLLQNKYGNDIGTNNCIG